MVEAAEELSRLAYLRLCSSTPGLWQCKLKSVSSQKKREIKTHMEENMNAFSEVIITCIHFLDLDGVISLFVIQVFTRCGEFFFL